MTGGLIQLVAKGCEDIFLTGNPEITFFKKVYKRHSVFSKIEYDLKFSNRLDFGKEGIIKIEKYADFLHRLFLVIKLPEVSMVYEDLTFDEIKKILAKFGIHIINNEITKEEMLMLINKKISDIEERNRIIQSVISLEHDSVDSILDELMKYDKYYDQYRFVRSLDREINLINVEQIVNHLQNNFKIFISGRDIFDKTTYNSQNILFLDYLEAYINEPHHNLDKYKHLDSYKIFSQLELKLANHKSPINIQEVIKKNLKHNIKLLINIYKSLGQDYKLVSHKLFTDNRNRNDHWRNETNFREIFEEINFDSPLNSFIREKVADFNFKNMKINNIFTDYYDNTELWSRINITDHELCPQLSFNNIYFMNFIPILTTTDIPSAIIKMLNTKIKKAQMGGNINKTLCLKNIKNILREKLEIAKQRILSVVDKKIREDVETIRNLYNCDKVADEDNIIIYTIRRSLSENGLNGSCLNYQILPEYIISEYLDVLDGMDDERLPFYNKYLYEKIVRLFITDDLPDHNFFKKNNYNISDLELNDKEHFYSDCISSIWYNLVKKSVKNYNRLYSDILDEQIYRDKFGIGIWSLLNQTKHKNKNDIVIFLEKKFLTLKHQLRHYEEHKNDLNIEISQVSKFDKYDKILSQIIDNRSNFFDEIYIPYGKTVADVFEEAYLKYKSKNTTDINITKYYDLFENIDYRVLYESLENLRSRTEFNTSGELYDCMTDIIIENSIWKDTEVYKIVELDNLINYLSEMATINTFQASELKKILSIFNNSGYNAKFAWIKNIGHYLINELKIYIGGQLIDTQYGEWLHIWHQLTKTKNKEEVYNKLIGNIE